MPASFATVETATVEGVVDEPMMISALDLGDEAPRVGGRRGRIAAIIEHDDLDRHAADFLRHEVERIAFGNAERRRRPGRDDGNPDRDLVGLRQRR